MIRFQEKLNDIAEQGLDDTGKDIYYNKFYPEAAENARNMTGNATDDRKKSEKNGQSRGLSCYVP